MHYIIKLMFVISFIFSSPVLSSDEASQVVHENPVKEKPSDAHQRPNVIIFLVDDLGYGDLGFAGHPTSTTRNIDTLARNGKVLTNFYVTSPVCSPSRASLLTGRYQVRSGVWPKVFFPPSINGLPKNETTIANILKNSGYMTQIIGKWHLGVGLNNEFLPGEGSYGFDNYFGIPYSHDMCPCPICYPNNGSCWTTSSCWNRKFVGCPLFRNKVIVDQPVYFPTMSQRYLDEAKRFILKSTEEGSPFFLYMPFQHIHVPQFASAQFAGKSPRGETGDSLLELDWMVGEITALLESLSVGNNTLTWFTSDNGPSLEHHEHGGSAGLLRCGKGTTWDGGVRVPSIVHWPGKIKAGYNKALTSTLDMLPTISSIIDVNIENLNLDGMDVSTVLFDEIEQSPRSFYAIYPEYPSQEEGPYAVVFNQYKAHFFTKGSSLSDDENPDLMCRGSHNVTKHDPPLLFDLYKDPGERYDIGKNGELGDILTTITEWRNEHMSTMVWMKSLTQDEAEEIQPCCASSTCTNFPECCVCPSKSDTCDSNSGNCNF